MSTIEAERDTEPVNPSMKEGLTRALKNPEKSSREKRGHDSSQKFDYTDSQWIDELSAEQLANAVVLQLDLQEERELAKPAPAKSERIATSAKKERGQVIFSNSVDKAGKVEGGFKTEPPLSEKQQPEKRLNVFDRAEQALLRGYLTPHEKTRYFAEIDFTYRTSKDKILDLEEGVEALNGRIALERNKEMREAKEKLVQNYKNEIARLKQNVEHCHNLLNRIDHDRLSRYESAEKEGMRQAEKAETPRKTEKIPAAVAEKPENKQLQEKLAEIERDLASFENLLSTDDKQQITAAYALLEGHVNHFLNDWTSDDKQVNAELARYWDAENGMGQRFIAAERAFNEKMKALKKAPDVLSESPLVLSLETRQEAVEKLKEPENQEAAILALVPIERQKIALRVTSAVTVGAARELALDNRFSALQKTELKKPEVTEAVAAEIKNKPINGYKLKSFLLNFSVGAGAGFLARTIGRRAVDFVFPGSSVVAGGVGGAAAESARFYLAERKRKKEVSEYTKSKDADIQLATKYVELLGKVKSGKGHNVLGDSLRLADLATEIKSKELKNVKGVDLLKKLVAIREGAATEAASQNKDSKKLLDALKSHYSTKTDKKRLAKAALRGALIGAAGGAVGGMIADYLNPHDSHVVMAMEAGKEKLTMLKGVATAGTPDILPMHRTVWETAKDFIRSQGIDPSNQNVLKAVKTLTDANDVDVAAWGETGRAIKDIAMQESHQLKGFHEVLKAFGKEAVEGSAAQTMEVTPGKVVTKLIDTAAVQDLDMRKIITITGTALGADYLWHRLSNRQPNIESSRTVVKGEKPPRRPIIEPGPIFTESTSRQSAETPSVEVAEGVEGKEQVHLSFDAIKDIIRSQIGNKAEITKLELTPTDKGAALSAELDAGMLGGDISLEGVIINAGNEISVSDLNVNARGYVKSRIEKSLSSFSPAIKTYFETKYGRTVSSIQISDSNIVIEFGSPSKKHHAAQKRVHKERSHAGGGGGGEENVKASKEQSGGKVFTEATPAKLFRLQNERLSELEQRLERASDLVAVDEIIKSLNKIHTKVNKGKVLKREDRKFKREYLKQYRTLLEKARAKEKSFDHLAAA